MILEKFKRRAIESWRREMYMYPHFSFIIRAVERKGLVSQLLFQNLYDANIVINVLVFAFCLIHGTEHNNDKKSVAMIWDNRDKQEL